MPLEKYFIKNCWCKYLMILTDIFLKMKNTIMNELQTFKHFGPAFSLTM